MKKICLFLATIFLISAKIFAGSALPDAGKNEKGLLDAIGPVITYTLLNQSSCTTTRTFTATITDVDGVNTTIGTRPRVYYKRNGDIDGYFGNTSATNGWKYAEASNVGSTFTFVIDYSLLNGGVVSGNTIQYFVVAQDLNGVPNVGVGSATTFATPPASVALTAAAFPVAGAINIYSIVNSLPTSMTIGSGFADFTALTTVGGLFSAINNVGLSGNTTIEIIDPLITENNAIPLYQLVNTGCAAGTVSLLIKPAAGVSPTITGSRPNEPIIRILSSNVTVDGSNNGTTSRNMTLTNTNTTSPSVILFGSLNAATAINNSTLKNTNCINTLSITNCVVVSDGNVGGNPGYFNNITIQNNSIQKSQIGINCNAVSSPGNGSVLITGNDLNATGASQIGSLGIYAEGLDGAVFSNNNIGNFEPAATTPRYGIWLNSNTINTTVSGNTISGISFTGTGSSITCGIYTTTAVAASNVTITDNTINNITSNATTIVYGIYVSSGFATGGITIQKNRISNIKNVNSVGHGAYGISLNSSLPAANITLANNFIYDIAGFGSATVVRNGFGIYLGAGGGYKLYYNSINMNANQTSPVAGLGAALAINGVSTASSLDVRNNIFVNTQTGGPPAISRYAIYCANANTIFSFIDYNDYFTATGTNLGFISGNRPLLTDIQTGFGAANNNNSVSVLPNFASATDLHLTPANCYLDGKATPVTITTDIDATTRNAATPDIGADEFTAVYSNTLAGIVATSVCDNKDVSVSGTIYSTAACNVIARVASSGGNPVAGKINACVTLDASPQFFNGEPYVQRHYDLEPAVSDQTTTSATVTLYFTDVEFENYNALNPVWPPLPTVVGGANIDPNKANVRVTQYHGPANNSPSVPGGYPGTRVLINPGAANVFWNGNYWEVTFNITGFSGFYLHSTLHNTPLPVVINYITGRKQGNDHLLNWKVTCNTSPRATMVLQRSNDSRNFSDLYSITADAARCNQPFDYTDANPLTGMNYYRIKVFDADGKISYSTTVALLNAVKGFDIVSIAPNPVVTGNFKLNVASAQAGNIEMMIFDMQGRLVKRQNLLVIAGYNSLAVDVLNLAAGTYTIKAGLGDEQYKVIRFVKE